MSVTSDGAQGATEEAKAAHLGRRSLGVADIVFFVVAASAPLLVVFVLALTNFDALLGSTPDDPLRRILPGLIVAAAVIGLVYGLALRRTRPDVYAMVGRGGDSA